MSDSLFCYQKKISLASLAMRSLSHPLITGKITVIDRMDHRESGANLAKARQDPRLVVIENELTDAYHDIEKTNPSGVFHLATSSDAPAIKSLDDTLELMDLLHRQKIPMAICSSASVYGSAPFPEKFSESTPLTPLNFAASIYAARDLLAQGIQQEKGQDLVMTRAAHCYGPGQDRTQLVPKMIYEALRDQPITIEGTGRRIRDWMHVDDCALGLISTFEQARNDPKGTLFHLGGNSERTDLGMARSVLKLLRKPENLITHVGGNLSEQDEREALDTRRALQLLKWKARIPFRSGFENTVREMAAHLRPEATTV